MCCGKENKMVLSIRRTKNDIKLLYIITEVTLLLLGIWKIIQEVNLSVMTQF